MTITDTATTGVADTMAQVKPIPDNYPQVVPYLYVDGASAAIGRTASREGRVR